MQLKALEKARRLRKNYIQGYVIYIAPYRNKRHLKAGYYRFKTDLYKIM